MKKRTRTKMLAFATSAAMMLGMGTTCVAAEPEEVSIGVIFYSIDDALGSSVYSVVNYAAQALGNVEVNWAVGAVTGADQITNAENLISSGVDGIMVISLDNSATQKISNLCEENGVYMSLCFRSVDESVLADVESNPYFVGYCCEDEAGTAYKMVEEISKQGSSKVCTHYVEESSSLSGRNDGFVEGIKEFGIEELANYVMINSSDNSDHINAVSNYLSFYPDCDTILVSQASSGIAESIMNILRDPSANTNGTKLATFDTFEGMSEGFENGLLSCVAGGIYPDALLSFMALYNAVTGYPLVEDGMVELMLPYMLISDADSLTYYESTMNDPEYRIFTEDQIRNLAAVYNPELTIDDFNAIIDNWSLDYVRSLAE